MDGEELGEYGPRAYGAIRAGSHKVCSSCGRLKLCSMFSRCAKHRDGLQSPCKDCERLPCSVTKVTHKECGRCRKSKKSEDFFKCKKHRDGLQSYCKKCDVEEKRWRRGLTDLQTRDCVRHQRASEFVSSTTTRTASPPPQLPRARVLSGHDAIQRGSSRGNSDFAKAQAPLRCPGDRRKPVKMMRLSPPPPPPPARVMRAAGAGKPLPWKLAAAAAAGSSSVAAQPGTEAAQSKHIHATAALQRNLVADDIPMAAYHSYSRGRASLLAAATPRSCSGGGAAVGGAVVPAGAAAMPTALGGAGRFGSGGLQLMRAGAASKVTGGSGGLPGGVSDAKHVERREVLAAALAGGRPSSTGPSGTRPRASNRPWRPSSPPPPAAFAGRDLFASDGAAATAEPELPIRWGRQEPRRTWKRSRSSDDSAPAEALTDDEPATSKRLHASGALPHPALQRASWEGLRDEEQQAAGSTMPVVSPGADSEVMRRSAGGGSSSSTDGSTTKSADVGGPSALSVGFLMLAAMLRAVLVQMPAVVGPEQSRDG